MQCVCVLKVWPTFPYKLKAVDKGIIKLDKTLSSKSLTPWNDKTRVSKKNIASISLAHCC